MRGPGSQAPGNTPGKSCAKVLRDDRLKAALKANMARRKAQARARTAQDDAGASGDMKQQNDAGTGADE